jgi:hypothetical protein
LIGGILNLIDPDLWKRKKSDQEISEEKKLVQSFTEMEKDVHNSPAKFYKSSKRQNYNNLKSKGPS